MTQAEELKLNINAMYDQTMQAVGIEVDASESFDSPEFTKELLEILATINAQTNQIASEVINAYTDNDDTQKRALLDHYASLKEYILENMLEDQGGGEGEG